MYYFFYFFIFLFGLAIGSFLNVVICRLETKEPVLFSRSHCPKCRTVLKWFELIPILSFFIQNGRCRSCQQKISWQYPLVELFTGLLFVSIIHYSLFIIHNSLLVTGYWLLVTIFLIIIFVYDSRHYLIPDKIIYPAILIVFLFIILQYFIPLREVPGLNSALLAVLIGAGFFFALVFLSKERWMGWGDVKLAVLMGLVLGWPKIALALFLSFVLGAFIGIILIILKKKTIKSQIPFGPFLALATFITMIYGEQILAWYWRGF